MKANVGKEGCMGMKANSSTEDGMVCGLDGRNTDEIAACWMELNQRNR